MARYDYKCSGGCGFTEERTFPVGKAPETIDVAHFCPRAEDTYPPSVPHRCVLERQFPTGGSFTLKGQGWTPKHHHRAPRN